jgi:hypothetical protein
MFIGTGKNGQAHQEGALADILSIRDGDNIIFYVMQYGFYGIFKAVGGVFYDYNSYANHHPQYLNSLLGNKTLTYRMLIQPFQVYQKGISEWDMMENPKFIQNQSIYNMQWSWIFKKLNASRGCLSIDEHEFALFKNILSNENQQLRNVVNYDFNNGNVVELNNNAIEYDFNCIQVAPRDNNRLEQIIIESDLRIMFTAKAGIDNRLDAVLNPIQNGKVNFIANEVLCSFSERKMDLLFGTTQNKCLLIELKNDFVFNGSIYNQIKEYARWVSAYKLQYRNIVPILVVREARDVAPSRGCKYYKYLSQNDKNNDLLSDWYANIFSQMKQAKIDLQNENIENVADLQIYTFSTGANNILVGFTRIV